MMLFATGIQSELSFALPGSIRTVTQRGSQCPMPRLKLLAVLDTRSSEIPVFRCSRAPRLAFVFTGQGAQWSQMGIQLNRYPIFQKSVEESDTYLRSALGCTWSATEEMRISGDSSQIHNPAFAQPLCTILQLALVDLLKSWNVVPSAVVGHSSGEIAAAYCFGALSREDALKAAYYRGLLAARMNELAPSIKGAMLAVGTSKSQAQDWIDEQDPACGEIHVACINSPSSVTLSGDVSAINKLQQTLKQKGFFARKLKVETAYHSPHMNVVSMLYMESLSSIQPKLAHESCRMYSTVTGCAVESSELGPTNWVRNLISPVLFYDALHEMLRPSKAKAEPVDILLELGPHSTLQGAVDQTIAKHNIDNTSYQSMLVRGQDATNTGLAAVASLFAQGVPVNLKSVNTVVEDTTVEAPTPLTNLPPYAWNHSRRFWAESRISKEYRLRQNPRLSLLGAPHPKMTGSARLWRGQIRVAEQPWIRDHKIHTSVLYPAAGYVAMAVEAAAQMATDDQKLREFRLRDVQIVAPAVIIEDSDLECVLEVRPHRTGNRQANTTWMQFSISSCHIREELRENCFGLLQMRYEAIKDSSVSFEDEQERCAARTRYYENDKLCDVSEDHKIFYDELAAIGLNYGSTFQNLSHCRTGPRRSTFTIAVGNPELASTSNMADRPHIIHPTNLDSVFHGVFAVLKGLKGHLKDAMVPTSIEEIAISADIPFSLGSLSKGFCTIWEHGFREVMADIVIFDEDLTSPTVTVKGFHCTEITGAGANATNGMDQMKTNIFSKMIWKPAAELLLPDQIHELVRPTTFSNTWLVLTDRIESCESQAIHHIQHALEETSYDHVLGVGSRKLYSWMQEQNKRVQCFKRDFPDSSGKKATDTQDGLEKSCVDSEVIGRIGRNITPILNGVVDIRELLLEMGLMDRWLSELLGLNQCLEKLGKVSSHCSE